MSLGECHSEGKTCMLKAVWLLSLSHRMCCAVSIESFSPAELIAAAFLEPVSLLFTACACLCDDPQLLSQQEWNLEKPIQARFFNCGTSWFGCSPVFLKQMLNTLYKADLLTLGGEFNWLVTEGGLHIIDDVRAAMEVRWNISSHLQMILVSRQARALGSLGFS